MKPLVSILVPAFNAEKWIGETLASAVAQTWEPKEIIVVDDGSTDRTLAIARQFESKNVYVVTQENQGAAASRNRALSYSQGEYIQWLDADDLLAVDKIEKQMEGVNQFQSRRTLLSSSWGRFMYRYHRAKFLPTALWNDLSPTEWLIRKMGQNLYMQTATWLVSRELTEAAGLWDTGLLGDDDGEYFCRVLLKSDGVRFIPGARVFYRMPRTSSLSYIGRSRTRMEAQWRSMQLHVTYLRSLENSERTRNACLQYLQNWLLSFYPQRPDIVDEIDQMAKDLGGCVRVPQLPWKYSWIEAIVGTNLARRAQIALPSLRWFLSACCDKFLFQLENRGLGARIS